MHEKLKSLLADDTLYIAFLLILVGIGSFGLGRLSMSESRQKTMETAPNVQLLASSSIITPKISTSSTDGSVNGAVVVTASETPRPAVDGPYVASKSGSKYYLITCAGVKRIKDANKVFFTTKQEAVAAGYTPATGCSM